MNKRISISNDNFDITVSKIGYGTYKWTLITSTIVLYAIDHNARNYDEFSDRDQLPDEYFGQIKRDLAEYIAAENNCIITFK